MDDQQLYTGSRDKAYSQRARHSPKALLEGIFERVTLSLGFLRKAKPKSSHYRQRISNATDMENNIFFFWYVLTREMSEMLYSESPVVVRNQAGKVERPGCGRFFDFIL